MARQIALLTIICGFALLCANVYADDATCEACHDDASLTTNVGGIPRSMFVNSGMVGKSVHDGLSCTDCHTSLEGFEDFPHPEKLPGVNCSSCHEDAFKMYMSGFYEHLAQRGFTSIPGCVQCHGKHEISHNPDTRNVCGICHREQTRQFEGSIHFTGTKDEQNQVNCTSCHSAHVKSERGNMLPKDWKQFTIDKCVTCHKDQSMDYLESTHFDQVKAGNPRAPMCTDCHGIHDLYAIDNPRSKVHIDKLDRTCDQCHPGHEATIHRKAGVDPRLETCAACHTGHNTNMERVESSIFKETLPWTCNRCHGDDRHTKENLAHGKIMMVDAAGGAANCTECHSYHWNLKTTGSGLPQSSSMQCANCHAQENKDYERSVHGIARAKGHPEAPDCATCHGDKEIERISSRFDGQTVISLCSSCHADRELTMKFQLNPKVVEGYLSTYHGQAYSLGYQGKDFATCTSCHDNHLILPKDNPQSTISQLHIVNTCGRCHEDSNLNFVGMLQHYDPMHGEQNVVLTVIHTFMVWLLGVTLSFFGLHTILWLVRAWIHRVKYGKETVDHGRKRVRYLRFNTYERVLHGMVMISFLLLAMTGLPLKYSHTEISQWIASHLLDLHSMALLHRIGAGLTFTYFMLHLGKLSYLWVSGRTRLLDLIWGENSLVPQPRDLKDFIDHFKYFLGMGPKPQFGKWSYWEKFDYLAVFWGVAVIGLSGLTLWFPEFFTKLLPGWAINAAHIIHSEEALLATGFIFTVHFFNEHLRPDNFPFDEVIFTGTMSEHYIKNERGRWFEQLRAEGRLDEYMRAPMHILPRILLYAFGFMGLAVGVALLTLIVIGTFFS